MSYTNQNNNNINQNQNQLNDEDDDLKLDIPPSNEYVGNEQLYSCQYVWWLSFLAQNKIHNWCDLCDLLLMNDEYQMQFSNVTENIVLLSTTHFTDNRNCNTELLKGLIFDKRDNLQQPIYIPEYTKPINNSIDILQEFELDMDNYNIYVVDKLTKYVVFYSFNDQSWCYIVHPDFKLMNTNKHCDLFYDKIFIETCNIIEFAYELELDKDNVYIFYIQHKKLMPLITTHKPKMWVYRIYNRKNYCRFKIDEINDFCESKLLPPLIKNKVETKYTLQTITENKTKFCKFLIEKYDDTWIITNNVYKNVLQYLELFWYDNIYERYLAVKKATIIQKNSYFNFFKNDVKKFEILDKIFHTLVSELSLGYIDIYVKKRNIIQSKIIIPNKHTLLYKIHLCHLQTSLPIYDADIELIILYVIPTSTIKYALEYMHQNQVDKIQNNYNQNFNNNDY